MSMENDNEDGLENELVETSLSLSVAANEVNQLKQELAKAQAAHKALSDTFRCFKCGDNSTPLYCLNCGGEIAVEELAKARAENQTLRNAQKACEDCDAPTIGEFKQLKAENARLAAETTRLLDALIAAEYILGRVETITLKGDENPPKYHWGEAADLVHSTLYQHQLEYAASQPQNPEQSILSAAVDKARGGPTPPKEYQGFA